MTRAVMQQALDALVKWSEATTFTERIGACNPSNAAIEALRAELAKPACYVVFNPPENEYVFVAGWPEACHEHINEAISEYDIEGANNWVVVSK